MRSFGLPEIQKCLDRIEKLLEQLLALAKDEPARNQPADVAVEDEPTGGPIAADVVDEPPPSEPAG